MKINKTQLQELIKEEVLRILKEDEENPESDLIDFKVPDWSLSYFIDGDSSGLEDDEIEKLDNFTEMVVAKYGNAFFILGDDEKDNLGFCPSNDIDNLGSNCHRIYINPD